MDKNEVKEYIALMDEAGLTTLRVVEGDKEIFLERKPAAPAGCPAGFCSAGPRCARRGRGHHGTQPHGGNVLPCPQPR